MKARRKSDGKIIEVEPAVYNLKNGEPYHKCLSDGHHYPASELDFNLDADTVIQGWVARNGSGPNDLGLRVYSVKPDRMKNRDEWNGHGEKSTLIDCRLFPDLTWDDAPIEVEIILKRKKI